ncbi:hypothetical protein D3C87_1966150 [compost metagenome]
MLIRVRRNGWLLLSFVNQNPVKLDGQFNDVINFEFAEDFTLIVAHAFGTCSGDDCDLLVRLVDHQQIGHYFFSFGQFLVKWFFDNM